MPQQRNRDIRIQNINKYTNLCAVVYQFILLVVKYHETTQNSHTKVLKQYILVKTFSKNTYIRKPWLAWNFVTRCRTLMFF